MTKCQCCGDPVWVMYSPAMCAPCEKAKCDPLGSGARLRTFDSDFGTLVEVEKVVPCLKPWV